MLKTLQAGRGLAALVVAAFHLSVVMGLPKYGGEAVFARWTGRGWLGVDFFFVLSGFIILLAHKGDLGRPARWRAYAAKRFVRLYPIYWLYTALALALVAAGLGAVQAGPGIADWVTAFSLVRLTDAATPISQAWTLFHEVVFYAVFSILILSRRWGLAAMAAWALAIAVLFTFPDPERDRSALVTVLGACNLHFFTGMGAFLLHSRLSRAQGLALAAAGLAGAVLLIGLGADEAAHPVLRLVWGLAFGAMLAGAAAVEARGARLKLPVLSFLGDASYTIYLLHTFVLGFVLKVLAAAGAARVLPPEAIYAVTFAATVAICSAAYVAVERPLLARLRRPRRLPDPQGLAAATTG